MRRYAPTHNYRRLGISQSVGYRWYKSNQEWALCLLVGADKSMRGISSKIVIKFVLSLLPVAGALTTLNALILTIRLALLFQLHIYLKSHFIRELLNFKQANASRKAAA